MTLHGFTHLALRVDDLRKAERVYADLFDLKVAFREVENADEGWTLPPSSTWDDAGVNAERGLVMLHRGGIRLALEGVQSICREGLLSHVGLHADARDLRRIRGRAAALGCRMVVDREAALIFDDPFGVRWELNTFPYDRPARLSTGARLGRWLQLESRGGAESKLTRAN